MRASKFAGGILALALTSVLIIFNLTSCDEKYNVTMFREAIDADNKATEFINQFLPDNNEPSFVVISEQISAQHLVLLKEALGKASKVKTEKLYALHKELPDKFRSQFVGGLMDMVYGREHENWIVYLSGQTKLNDFGNWYMETIKKKGSRKR